MLVSLIPAAPSATLSTTLRIVTAKPPPLPSRRTLEDRHFPEACHLIDVCRTADQKVRANERRMTPLGTIYEMGTHQQEQL